MTASTVHVLKEHSVYICTFKHASNVHMLSNEVLFLLPDPKSPTNTKRMRDSGLCAFLSALEYAAMIFLGFVFISCIALSAERRREREGRRRERERKRGWEEREGERKGERARQRYYHYTYMYSYYSLTMLLLNVQ